MIKHNISPELFVEIIKGKVYPKLQLILSQEVQNMKLRTEKDLIEIFMKHIYAGFGQDTLKSQFEKINASRLASNVEISLIYQDIITSQAPALVQLSDRAIGCGPEARSLLTHSYAKNLLFQCIPAQKRQLLGLQGITQREDLTEVVEAVARMDLYAPGKPEVQISQMNLAPALSMLEIPAPSPAPVATKTPSLTVELAAVKKQLANCQRELSKFKGQAKPPRIQENDNANVGNVNDKPAHVYYRQCKQCQKDPSKTSACGHCRRHTTETNKIDFRSCPLCKEYKDQQRLAAVALEDK